MAASKKKARQKPAGFDPQWARKTRERTRAEVLKRTQRLSRAELEPLLANVPDELAERVLAGEVVFQRGMQRYILAGEP